METNSHARVDSELEIPWLIMSLGSFLFPCIELLCGMVVIADQVKPEARVTVRELHKMGLRVCMLTGDNRRTAEAIAQEVKVDLTGNLNPIPCTKLCTQLTKLCACI